MCNQWLLIVHDKGKRLKLNQLEPTNRLTMHEQRVCRPYRVVFIRRRVHSEHYSTNFLWQDRKTTSLLCGISPSNPSIYWSNLRQDNRNNLRCLLLYGLYPDWQDGDRLCLADGACTNAISGDIGYLCTYRLSASKRHFFVCTSPCFPKRRYSAAARVLPKYDLFQHRVSNPWVTSLVGHSKKVLAGKKFS